MTSFQGHAGPRVTAKHYFKRKPEDTCQIAEGIASKLDIAWAPGATDPRVSRPRTDVLPASMMFPARRRTSYATGVYGRADGPIDGDALLLGTGPPKPHHLPGSPLEHRPTLATSSVKIDSEVSKHQTRKGPPIASGPCLYF